MRETGSSLPGLSVINDVIRLMSYQEKKKNNTKQKQRRKERKNKCKKGKEERKKKLMSFELIPLEMIMTACIRG